MPEHNRSNMGNIWLNEEYDQLRKEFADRMDIEDIANAHGRTAGAIISKMLSLGMIVDYKGSYYRIEQDPWTDYRQIRLIDRGTTNPV